MNLRDMNDAQAKAFFVARSKAETAMRRAIKRVDAKNTSAERAKALVNGAKVRAILKKLPFDLDKKAIAKLQSRIDLGVCELSGVPLRFDGGRTFDSPSLDRIEPALGYVYSNVRVICAAMNSALGNWGEDRLMAVLQSWQERQKLAR